MAKKESDKIRTDYQIAEFDTMKKMWDAIGTDICAVQYGATANDFYEMFNIIFNRYPEIIYKFNGTLYIPITKSEHKAWVDSRF